jgi:hypothetical protein
MTNEPNEGMQTTAYSLRFAAAFGRAGCPALTIYQHKSDYQETCVFDSEGHHISFLKTRDWQPV